MSADTLEIDNQYATGLSRHNLERALVTFGKDLNHMRPSDLGELEDFHTLGRMATRQLADLAEITSHDEVLDAGSGIGGTARFLADQYGCRITTIDLTEERYLGHHRGNTRPPRLPAPMGRPARAQPPGLRRPVARRHRRRRLHCRPLERPHRTSSNTPGDLP